MGVSLILADKTFEEVADGTQSWVVSAQYDFDAEKYTDYVILNKKDVTALASVTDADKMYVYYDEDGTALSDTTLPSITVVTADCASKINQRAYVFGDNDSIIGKINTNGKITYIAIITEQDVKGAKVNLKST